MDRKKSPPIHPGSLLRKEFLPRAELTQVKLAKLLGVSHLTINEIVREKRGVTPDMAHRLARFFSTTPEFWARMQQDVDLWRAAQEKQEEHERIKPYGK